MVKHRRWTHLYNSNAVEEVASVLPKAQRPKSLRPDTRFVRSSLIAALQTLLVIEQVAAIADTRTAIHGLTFHNSRPERDIVVDVRCKPESRMTQNTVSVHDLEQLV